MGKNIGTPIVDEYLKRYPTLPSLRIAKVIYKKHPLIFKSVEDVRSLIRYRRGSSGTTLRKDRGLTENITPKYVIPKSAAQPKVDFKFDGVERVAVLSDIHIPYHTENALECAIKRAKRDCVDGILLNGDTIDCHRLSRFTPNPEARNFKEERNTVKQFLGYLRQEFPKARIVWKDGNHEERFSEYMRSKAPEIFDQEFFSLNVLLGFENLGIEYVSNRRIVWVGNLPVMHGHEFFRGFAPPVNPARGAYLKAKQSVMVGHHHKTSEHTETSLDGTITTTWSVGCLSDLNPDYNPYPGYNHGAATIFLKDEFYEVNNYRIVDGRAMN